MWIALAFAVVGGLVALANGGPSSATPVYALAVPAESLAGPCAGMPSLSAENLAYVFAPAGDKGGPVPIKVLSDSSFAVTYGPSTYTVTLADDGSVTATGPDDASAKLLSRHVALCTGAVTMTPDDAPGTWTTDGRYSADGNAPTADR